MKAEVEAVGYKSREEACTDSCALRERSQLVQPEHYD